MWICPKCFRENGNSFNSCKGCGYVISKEEKEIAIKKTRQQLNNYNSKHSQQKNNYETSTYAGPKVEYDEDDSYLADYYSDDMFDDDDVQKPKFRVLKAIIVILIILGLAGGGLYFLDSQGIVNVFSSTNYKFENNGDGISITGYKGQDTTIEIPQAIDGKTVNSISDKAFAESNLKSVTIPSSVKTIGTRAFFDCEYLHIVNLQDGLETIGDYAFASCKGLSDTFIPPTVVNIGTDILKDSNDVYIQGVPGTTAMTYAINNDVRFTPTNQSRVPYNVTPVRVNDRDTYTTSKAGFGAGYMFSYVPYESSKFKITVEASIDGYLVINDFGTMEGAVTKEIDSGSTHSTVVTATLKKERKYYFAIENQGTEENKNIEFLMNIEPVTDKQTIAENKIKGLVENSYTFTAYTDLFYDDHSETGESHYLEWDQNVQRIVDYYVGEKGEKWVAINAPEENSYSEEGIENTTDSGALWWHKLEE